MAAISDDQIMHTTPAPLADLGIIELGIHEPQAALQLQGFDELRRRVRIRRVRIRRVVSATARKCEGVCLGGEVGRRREGWGKGGTVWVPHLDALSKLMCIHPGVGVRDELKRIVRLPRGHKGALHSQQSHYRHEKHESYIRIQP
jgi:hypothetical protein